MEDVEKIQRMVNKLNEGLKEPVWIAIAGFSAAVSFEPKGKGERPLFNPSVGIPLKLFVNTSTGEIKTYHANVFTSEDLYAA